MFTARIFFRVLYTAFSNARMQPLKKARILIVTIFIFFFMHMCEIQLAQVRIIGALKRIIGEVYGNKRIEWEDM